METRLDFNIHSTNHLFHECTAVKTISIIMKVISSFTMFYFAKPKIMALPVSVLGFQQFGEVLHISGTAFMYFTGYTELLIGILLIGSIFITKQKLRDKLALVGYFLLSSTMIGAIITEIYIRDTPKVFLIELAVAFLLISIIHASFIITRQLFNTP